MKLRDEQLRKEIDAGQTPRQIARKFHCSRQTVYRRLRKIDHATSLAVVRQKAASQVVGRTIDAVGQLVHNLARVNQLFSACHEWLTDPDDPTRYTIEPRAEEIQVVYETTVQDGRRTRTERHRASLQELLDRMEGVGAAVNVESRHADPRELHLRAAQEARQTVAQAGELMRLLADARRMEDFQSCLPEEIAKVAPDVREAIVHALQRKLTLRGAVEGTLTV